MRSWMPIIASRSNKLRLFQQPAKSLRNTQEKLLNSGDPPTAYVGFAFRWLSPHRNRSRRFGQKQFGKQSGVFDSVIRWIIQLGVYVFCAQRATGLAPLGRPAIPASNQCELNDARRCPLMACSFVKVLPQGHKPDVA